MNYTPSQVSEMLGIPGSTLRHYARHFTKYLSPQQGRKQRLYTDKDILVFSQIKDLSALNIPLELIGPRLHVDDQQPAQLAESSLAYVPSIAAEIESAQAATRAALAKIDQLTAKVDQLAAQIEEIKARDSRPWYKRLLG
jgi:DNA-binding transcriptional MerR regulator